LASAVVLSEISMGVMEFTASQILSDTYGGSAHAGIDPNADSLGCDSGPGSYIAFQ
jgi:hypothetical protein